MTQPRWWSQGQRPRSVHSLTFPTILYIITSTSPRWRGFGLFLHAAPNGRLSVTRNEHHWDEMKSLPGLSGQHIQPSPRWTTASCRPPGSPPTSSPPAPALVVKGRLPARGGWRFAHGLEWPRTLRESPSINMHHSYLNRAWGLSGKHKTGGTASSFMLHTLSWEKCIQSDLTNRLATSISASFW